MKAGSFISTYGELWLTVCIVSMYITGADSKIQHGRVMTLSLVNGRMYFKKCNYMHFSVVFEAMLFLGRTLT